jgi:regulator of replication initiation timing
MDAVPAIITALGTLIVAVAGLVKATQSVREVKELRERVEKLSAENGDLKEKLEAVMDENKRLLSQNSAMAAIIDEYRGHILRRRSSD